MRDKEIEYQSMSVSEFLYNIVEILERKEKEFKHPKLLHSFVNEDSSSAYRMAVYLLKEVIDIQNKGE